MESDQHDSRCKRFCKISTKVKGAKQTLDDLKDLYDFSRRRPTKAKGFRIEFSVFGFNTFKEVPP